MRSQPQWCTVLKRDSSCWRVWIPIRGSRGTIDYRLSDAAKFPAQIQDVKAAVRWLRANAARFHLDPTRFVAWGSGAGGHLAALLGTSDGIPSLEDLSEGNSSESSAVQGVIDFAGPIDLLQLQKDALPCSTKNYDSSGSEVSILLGCTLQICRDAAAAADPTTYVTSDDPPFFIAHGAQDCDVAPAQSIAFHRALGFEETERVVFFRKPLA